MNQLQLILCSMFLSPILLFSVIIGAEFVQRTIHPIALQSPSYGTTMMLAYVVLTPIVLFASYGFSFVWGHFWERRHQNHGR